MRPFLYSLAAVASLAAAPAIARPSLVSAQPAQAARASNVRAVSVTFSERLTAGQSGFELVMTGMPGMSNHAPMKMTGFRPELSPDGKTLRATLPRALPAGTYELKWFAAGADAQRASGVVRFTAR